MPHGKVAVDGLGVTVKHFLWIFAKAGGNAPLDAMSYSKLLVNAIIFFI